MASKPWANPESRGADDLESGEERCDFQAAASLNDSDMCDRGQSQ